MKKSLILIGLLATSILAGCGEQAAPDPNNFLIAKGVKVSEVKPFKSFARGPSEAGYIIVQKGDEKAKFTLKNENFNQIVPGATVDIKYNKKNDTVDEIIYVNFK